MKQAKYKKIPFQINMEMVTNITLAVIFVGLFALAGHLAVTL